MKFKRLADLNRRVVTSTLTALIVVGLIVFSSHLWVSALLVLIVGFLAAVGVWEYAQLAHAKDLKPASGLMIIMAVCVVFSFFISQKFPEYIELPATVLIIAAASFFIRHFKNTSNALILTAMEFFGVCYVAIPISFFLGILYSSEQGKWWLLYLIVVTKVTDVGAYFVGRLWGRQKLAPRLSPKKTVEGAIAGFSCALAASVAIAFLAQPFPKAAFGLTLSQSVWLGMLIGIFGQVGDLAESLLKRDAVVKDSNTLPGLGGVLDMVDSLLFTGPIVYFFLKFH
jgi:phosphatidate cytidylyltransferase